MKTVAKLVLCTAVFSFVAMLTLSWCISTVFVGIPRFTREEVTYMNNRGWTLNPPGSTTGWTAPADLTPAPTATGTP